MFYFNIVTHFTLDPKLRVETPDNEVHPANQKSPSENSVVDYKEKR